MINFSLYFSSSGIYRFATLILKNNVVIHNLDIYKSFFFTFYFGIFNILLKINFIIIKYFDLNISYYPLEFCYSRVCLLF